MTDELPDLVTKFKADISEMIAEMEAGKLSVKQFGDQAAKLGKDFKKGLGDGEKATDDLGAAIKKNSREGQSAWQALTKTIEDYRAKVKTLQRDITTAGGSGGAGASLFGDLKKAKGDLSSLTSMAKDIIPSFGKAGADSSIAFGSEFAKGIENFQGPMGLSGPVGIGIIAGLATIAPVVVATVGAMLSGAILTGLGAGVVASAIFAWRGDPRIKAATNGLGSLLTNTLKSATQDFVPYLAEGINDFKGDIAGIGPDLRKAFDALLPAVKPLIDGLGGFITHVLPGLEKGVEGAEPVLEQFAKLLPWLGTNVGDLFKHLGEGASGAKQGITALVTLLGGAINFTGIALRDLSGLFSAINQFAVHLAHAAADVAGFFSHIPGSGVTQKQADAIYNMANNIQGFIDDSKTGTPAVDTFSLAQMQLADRSAQAAQALRDETSALDDNISAIQKSRDADLRAADAKAAFLEGVQKGTKNWSENTKAGRANLELLSAYDEALSSKYAAQMKDNSLTSSQAQAYLKAEQALYAQAQAAGASKDALAPYAAEIKLIKGYIDGLKDKTVSVNIVTNYKSTGHPGPLNPGTGAHASAGAQGGIFGGGASGGVARAYDPYFPAFDVSGVYKGSKSGMYRFAEQSTGKEALIAQYGDRNRQMATIAEAASWMTQGQSLNSTTNNVTNYGGQQGNITVVVPVSLGGKHLATVSRALVPSTQQAKIRGNVSGLG